MARYVRIVSLVHVQAPDGDYVIYPPDASDLASLALDLLVQELGTEGARLFLRKKFAQYRPDYMGVGRDTGDRLKEPRSKAPNFYAGAYRGY
ncbi:hypothetical protein D9M68_900490 [compost metagenome]